MTATVLEHAIGLLLLGVGGVITMAFAVMAAAWYLGGER